VEPIPENPHGSFELRPKTILVLVVPVALLALLAFSPVVGQASAAPRLSISQTWSVTLPDAGAPVALSSPNVAQLAGGPAVVVGDRAGHVWALSLASGAGVQGWPFNTGGVPVDSTPSVAATTGINADSVYVGVGNAATPRQGGYQAIYPNGTNQWFVGVQNPSSDAAPATAVQASMAVGNLQGATDVVAGSLGQETYAIDARDGGTLSGFPWFQADSNFATPAVADLYGDGSSEIIEGGDSSAGLAYGRTYSNGGHLRILSPYGAAGSSDPAGGEVCQFDTNQTVQSSPAVGGFLSGGKIGIAFGTGATFPGASATNSVFAVDSHCGLDWIAQLDGITTSSPAIADVEGNGQLQIVEGTNNGSGGGSVWVLQGSNGASIWHAATAGAVIGSVVTADLGGSGHQDVIVPTTNGVQVFDGQSGAVVATIGAGIGFQNSPLVTDDPNGSIGITIAGYNSSNTGQIEHYEVEGSSGSAVNEPGSWPMFHHDPQLTGFQPGDATEFVSDGKNGRPWNAYDLTTAVNGPGIVGSPTALVDPRDGLVHAFARASNGDLLEYVNDQTGPQPWSVTDLTAIAGGAIPLSGDPDPVYDSAQGLLHVYSEGSDGDLLEYVNDGASGNTWNAYDLSFFAGNGSPVTGTASAVYDSAQDLVHVYVQSAAGHLVEYLSDHASGHVWNAYDLSLFAGGGSPVGGSPGAFYHPVQDLVHVYVRSAAGDLVEYVSDHLNGHVWNAYDLTVYAGGGSAAFDTPKPVYDAAQDLVHVYVRGPGGHLVEYLSDHASGHVWNAYDLSANAGSGGPIWSSPGAVYIASQEQIHVYAEAPGGDLVEYVSDHLSGHVWNAYDLTAGSGGPEVNGQPSPVILGGLIHVYVGST